MVGEEIKQCDQCQAIYPYNGAGFDLAASGDYYSTCRACRTEYYDESWQTQWDLGREYECQKKKDDQRNSYLLQKYALSLSQYNAFLSLQGGVCAICYRPENKMVSGRVCNLAVDHCHHTGRVRGLLCSRCNLGLGHFQDSLNFLRSAIDYIEDKKLLSDRMYYSELSMADSL